MVILYSSKTHSKESNPQEIKITAMESSGRKRKFFCPFTILRTYIEMRSPIHDINESFFVYADRRPLNANTLWATLHSIITSLNLNSSVYDFHSFRTGRSMDLLKFGFTVEQIKRIGRWKSNAVYKYLKPFY